MAKDYTFKILEFSNYDGDSFDLTLDLGFDLIIHRKVRINGIDTPELRGGTDDSKAAGRLAKNMATDWVQNAIEFNGGAYFQSQCYTGKFGRPLGDIIDNKNNSLVDYLLKERLAVPYKGQAKKDIQDLHDANIKYLKEDGWIE